MDAEVIEPMLHELPAAIEGILRRHAEIGVTPVSEAEATAPLSVAGAIMPGAPPGASPLPRAQGYGTAPDPG